MYERSSYGWIRAINEKIGKTIHEQYDLLQNIKFNWKQSISQYITNVMRVALEAGEKSHATQIHHIVKHLPDKFLIGLDVEQPFIIGVLGRPAHADV